MLLSNMMCVFLQLVEAQYNIKLCRILLGIKNIFLISFVNNQVKMQQNAPQVSNIQSYHDHFRSVADTIKLQPKRDRSMNDKCCYLVFIIITLAFIGIGCFYIRSSSIRQIIRSTVKNQQYSDYIEYASNLQGYNLDNLKPGLPIIIGMLALTVVMAILFLCLLVRFPKCVFITMLILGAALMGTITALLFYIGALIPAIIMCILSFVLVVVLLCSFNKIRTGIVLLNVASKFLLEKPSTFLAPVFVMIFIVVFECYWAMGLAGITLYKGGASTEQQISQQKQVNSIVSFFWVFFNLFYSFFFYYCISFMIATAAGIWYYNEQQHYLPRSVARIFKYHLGSFTFASLLVTIVSLTRQYAEKQARSGVSIATFCICMLACCIKCMEDLLETLNHNAIITMSITGQSYFDSAKSTLSLIFENFPLFFLVDLMSHMVTITGVVFICGVPGIVGFILLKSTAENPDDTTTIIIGTVIIILFGMLVGAIFLSVLSEALSCMFIFFCLDRRFLQLGLPATDRAPQEIKEIFKDLAPYVGGEYNQNYDTKKNQQKGQYNSVSEEPADIHQRGPEFF